GAAADGDADLVGVEVAVLAAAPVADAGADVEFPRRLQAHDGGVVPRQPGDRPRPLLYPADVGVSAGVDARIGLEDHVGACRRGGGRGAELRHEIGGEGRLGRSGLPVRGDLALAVEAVSDGAAVEAGGDDAVVQGDLPEGVEVGLLRVGGLIGTPVIAD